MRAGATGPKQHWARNRGPGASPGPYSIGPLPSAQSLRAPASSLGEGALVTRELLLPSKPQPPPSEQHSHATHLSRCQWFKDLMLTKNRAQSPAPARLSIHGLGFY